MCSLCGVLGCDDHWTNPVARPGVYSRNTDTLSRRAETTRRLKAVNAILSFRRLKLNVWQGRSYVVSSPTGKSSIFEALSHLWPEAEALTGKGFDPLDEDLMTWMEREAGL